MILHIGGLRDGERLETVARGYSSWTRDAFTLAIPAIWSPRDAVVHLSKSYRGPMSEDEIKQRTEAAYLKIYGKLPHINSPAMNAIKHALRNINEPLVDPLDEKLSKIGLADTPTMLRQAYEMGKADAR